MSRSRYRKQLSQPDQLSRPAVRRLLDAGADPNAEWLGDGNPLIIAAVRWDDETIERLLSAGADPDRLLAHGATE